MFEAKKDGSTPAFPCHPEVVNGYGVPQDGFPGMTLRQYFAAEAMKGFLSKLELGWSTIEEERLSRQWVARQSVNMADTLIAVLNETTKP